MKYDFHDELVAFIPEDDADVFNLGKVVTHFSRKASWKTVKGITKLEVVFIHISDLFTTLSMLLEKQEHHFIKRDL